MAGAGDLLDAPVTLLRPVQLVDEHRPLDGDAQTRAGRLAHQAGAERRAALRVADLYVLDGVRLEGGQRHEAHLARLAWNGDGGDGLGRGEGEGEGEERRHCPYRGLTAA